MDKVKFQQFLQWYKRDFPDGPIDTDLLEPLADWDVSFTILEDDGRRSFDILIEPPDE